MKVFNISTYVFIITLLSTALLFNCTANADSRSGEYTSSPATPITLERIETAQQQWIQALVSIGTAHANNEDAAARATEVLNNYYDFENGVVLFKPTLTFGEQTFRPTFEGAHAYFVGGNSDFPNDNGFALRPYVNGSLDSLNAFIHGDVAIAQSNITLEAYDGSTVTVNKTFGYRQDENGNLRIVTHHSSLPFAP
ncbi:MAG: hypothetical protein LAT67_13655 [Balneolales bacterium]|nr:hypothetical protein [Balneolales bacterium]